MRFDLNISQCRFGSKENYNKYKTKCESEALVFLPLFISAAFLLQECLYLRHDSC